MDKPVALVVEDTIELAEIFTRAIETAGFSVETCYTGEDALTKLAEIVPDIALIDLHLPHISGEKIVDTIIADSRFKQTRVIVASADARLAESLRDKVDLVLVKPVNFIQLRELATRLNPQSQ